MAVSGTHCGLTEPGAFPFWSEARLRHFDTDDQGHVNHVTVVSLLETARDEYLCARWGFDAARTNVLIVGLDLQFHNELAYPNDVRIGTGMGKVGNSSFAMQQGLFRNGLCVATGLAKCVLIDRETRKPMRVPDAVRHSVAIGVGGIARRA